MDRYTKANIQNVLADIANGIPTQTAAKNHSVPRSTLRDRISGSQNHKSAYSHMQRLSPEQEDRLATWILRQESLNYAPTHAQVRAIATGVLKRASDHQPLGKK
jgi:hypothetical protein